MSKKLSLSISSKLIFLIVSMSLLTLGGVSMFNFYTSDKILKQRVEDQLISESTSRGTAIVSLIETRIQQITLLSTNQNIREAVKNSSTNLRLDMLKSEIMSFDEAMGESIGLDSIKVIGKDGKIIYDSLGANEQNNFADPRLERGLEQAFLDFDYIQGQRKLTVLVPIKASQTDSTSIGVVMAVMDTDVLDKILLNRKGLGETGEVYLVNSQKLMLTESRFIESAAFAQKVDTFPVQECFEKGKDSNSVYPDYRNIRIVGISFCVRDLGFVLLAEIDEAEIFKPIINLRNELLGIGILLSGLIIAVAIIVSMGITKPILKLRDAADLIGKGNFDHKIIARSNDEIGDLARQFESMRKNIQEKNTNLNEIVKERTKDFTNIMNTLNATAIVAITDKDGIIKHVNQKFVEISGYAKEELIGQNHRILKSGYHKPEFFDNMWKIISGGKTFEGEIKNKAKDGKFYWVKTTIVPFLDETGNPEEYIAIHDDITKLKNIEEELQDALRRNEKDASIIQHQMEDLKIANLELQQKDKLKHEFLSMASHELKTPLTPILGWCDALKSPQILGNLSPNQLSAIETIEKNAEKLEKLIGDMLDVQKLELDEIKFNISDVAIEKILDTLKKDFEFAVKEKNITLEISSDTGITIKSDERRIIQVLSALIYNSIDFVPEKSGRINVMVNKKDDEVLFCVQDNGMGIPKEKQQYLFKKFYQVDTSLTRKHGGTGLGLVISKGLVEGLGGKIWVDTDIGKGTKFYFTIPVGLK